jgi:hypothetical protein
MNIGISSIGVSSVTWKTPQWFLNLSTLTNQSMLDCRSWSVDRMIRSRWPTEKSELWLVALLLKLLSS